MPTLRWYQPGVRTSAYWHKSTAEPDARVLATSLPQFFLVGVSWPAGAPPRRAAASPRVAAERAVRRRAVPRRRFATALRLEPPAVGIGRRGLCNSATEVWVSTSDIRRLASCFAPRSGGDKSSGRRRGGRRHGSDRN